MDLSSSPLRANLELKASLADYGTALETCLRIGAVDQGTLKQVDTYFTLGRYRLKLREASGQRPMLIGYSRPDETGVCKSQFRMAEVVAPRNVKRALTSQWGVKAVVVKARHLFVWQRHVRIHLDRVEGLGDFVEFEAALDAADLNYDESTAQLDLARLRHDFGIREPDLVATSYGVLMRDRLQALAGG